MKIRIRKWGNSLGIVLPREIVHENGFNERMEVEIKTENGKVIIEKLKYPSFEELFHDWDGEGAPEGEFEWFDDEEPKGKEEW